MSTGGEILKKLLSSEVKGDLLVLFRKNPGLIDSMDGVARRIGLVPKSVEEDVRDLVGLGILATKQIGNSEAIYLDRGKDKEIQETVADYLRGLKKDG
ncbi:MAG: hypothetical protein JRN39_02690 [Nitrososphaerota archaeon]|nr:hypothetical protein [Nitrososphaerota archaeon]